MTSRTNVVMKAAFGPEGEGRGLSSFSNSSLLCVPIAALAVVAGANVCDFQIDPGPISGRIPIASHPPEAPRAGVASASPAAEAASFLSHLQDIANDDEPEDGLDAIYISVDRFMRRGRFDVCDELLKSVSVSALPVIHLLALVSVTKAAREEVASRDSFVARVRSHLEKVDPSRVKELLAGIE